MSNFCLLLSNTLQYLKFRLRYFQNWDVRMFMIVPLHETHPKFAENMENSFDIKIFSLLTIQSTSPVWPTPQKRLVLNIVKQISWCHWQKWYDQGWTFWREKCPSNFPKSIWRICLLKNSLTLQWLRNDQNVSKNTKKIFICIFKISSNSVILPFFSKQHIIFSKLTFFPRPDIFVLEFWIEKHSNYVSRDEKLKSTSFH